MHYGNQFDVIETLMCFDWSSASVKQEILTLTAHVNAGLPLTGQTPDNDDVVITAVERSRGEVQEKTLKN
jgi:hypothetical protein